MFEELNPWWEKEKWEEADKHLRTWKAQKTRWLPQWSKQVSLEPFSLNFVIGPRQVGKTTGLKLLIKEILKHLDKSKAVLYLNLEFFSALAEFRDAIKKYLEIKKEEKIKSSFIFLDEATRLPGWDRIVKGFIELGAFEKDVITVSGSSSMHLLKHADSFPGRKGKGKKIFVMPVNFKEFVEIHGVNPGKYYSNERKILKLFEKYLYSGGFPLSINNIPFYEDFIESLEREILEARKSVKIMRQIISEILNIVPSATSFNAIGSKIGISHYVVEEYLEILDDLFALKIAYWKDNKKVSFRKEKKIFFRDPFIFRAFSLISNKEIRREALLEHIVQEHLYRKFGEIYYFKNSYEIDCIARDLKIEVKAGKPRRKYPKGVRILEEQDIPRFLIELFSK